ncbi:MAG: hypothetical protein IBX64_06875 [Actinobacteria bacterium]|nr:hypothetical protein [Actinomycetota bacterium]
MIFLKRVLSRSLIVILPILLIMPLAQGCNALKQDSGRKYMNEFYSTIKTADKVLIYKDDMPEKKFIRSYSMRDPEFKDIATAMSSVTRRGEV